MGGFYYYFQTRILTILSHSLSVLTFHLRVTEVQQNLEISKFLPIVLSRIKDHGPKFHNCRKKQKPKVMETGLRTGRNEFQKELSFAIRNERRHRES